MILSEAIKKIRYEMRLSQQDLADILGCTQTSVSAYELDQRKPRYAILKKLDDYAKKHKIKVTLI